jgi:hypothetical protein
MKLPFAIRIWKSKSKLTGISVATFLIPFPTVKLAEIRTHRLQSQTDDLILGLGENNKDLSMNANSSRAIPVEKVIQICSEGKGFEPMWTKNQKGMSGEELSSESDEYQCALDNWDYAQSAAINSVLEMQSIGIHKQDANLLLHPFSWSAVVITADAIGWYDFFKQRCKEDVYPAVQFIAREMQQLWDNTEAAELEEGEWHIPFCDEHNVTDILPGFLTLEERLMVSASCCARISYNNLKGETLEAHQKRAQWCFDNGHLSVAEHQLRAPTKYELLDGGYFNIEYGMYQVSLDKSVPPAIGHTKGKYVSNIQGWIQYRKILENNEEV